MRNSPFLRSRVSSRESRDPRPSRYAAYETGGVDFFTPPTSSRRQWSADTAQGGPDDQGSNGNDTEHVFP